MKFSHQLSDKLIIRKAEWAILSHSYSRLTVSFIASLFCATIIYIGLHKTTHFSILSTWYLSFLAIAFARLFVKVLFDASKSTEENFSIWKKLFIIGALFSGACWGALSAFVMPVMGNLQQVLCLLILAGVTAGSVASLSGVLSASIGFLILALLPYIILLGLSHNFIHRLFDLALVGYLVYLIALSINTHSTIKKIIYLQFENLALIEKLEHLATHDPLLHIDNSRLFYVNFKNAVKRAARSQKLLALLYIDVDNFKQVNDAYGHRIGDKFLLKVVERIKENLRETDLIARVGGDEFAVILENFDNKAAIEEVANKICHTISSSQIKIEDAIISISTSIGISVYPLDGTSIKKLISIADSAMYLAKKSGRNKCHFGSENALSNS